MELTSDDRMRAANLGMDAAEDSETTGQRRETLDSESLWHAVMGDAARMDYPADAVSNLRDSFDGGARDFY